MVCKTCKDQKHAKCVGFPFCDCQHENPWDIKKVVEPPLGWVNQTKR